MPLVHTISELESITPGSYKKYGGELYSNERMYAQISGEFTGLVKFECSIDEQEWFPMGVFPVDGGGGVGNQQAVTETDEPGIYVAISFPHFIRVLVPSSTVGSPDVVIDMVSHK